MKIGNLEIPEDLEHLVSMRSKKDMDGLEAWVARAHASKLTHEEMRNTLVVSAWAGPFVDWYLAAAPQGATPWADSVKNPKTGAEMILIPEGEFIMGERMVFGRKRKVFLDACRIGRNPVTVGEFKAYCAAAKVDFTKYPAPSWGWKDDHPMVNVSWHQARDFCVWAGGDLPTEAQWEKAARGTDGREYPWGDQWDADRCHCSKNSWNDAKSIAPVGGFPSGASPFGCLDMAGNVWEWCLDWYAEGYGGQPNRNPTGPTSGGWRVLRGGSWFYYGPEDFRSAFRCYDLPAIQGDGSGFRLAGPQ